MSNERRYSIVEILEGAKQANVAIQQWVPQTWIDALLNYLRAIPEPKK